jgi:hypothetical protein
MLWARIGMELKDWPLRQFEANPTNNSPRGRVELDPS